MDFNEYQEKALTTLIETKDKDKIIARLTLGIAGESGEIVEKVKKYMRGDYPIDFLSEYLFGELSDCLWYIAILAHILGFNLDTIAKYNIRKLQSRKERGKIKGSGDIR